MTRSFQSESKRSRVRSWYYQAALCFSLSAGFAFNPIAGLASSEDLDVPAPLLETPTATSTLSDEQIRVPPHERAIPTFGLQIQGAAKPFTGGNDLPTQADGNARTAHVEFELLPHFAQHFGILGFGVHGDYTFYTTSPTTQSGPTSFPSWAVGAQVRYQARYFSEQLLVPVAGYRIDAYRYRRPDNRFGSITASGPFAGAWILLNQIDPDSTRTFFVDVGVCRTYLIAEAHMLRGNDAGFTLAGRTYLFGLRFEF